MILALEIVLVISAVLMTVFVLLHKGKGGGLSSLFGGGVQSNLSGSTVVEKNLDRYTIVMVIIWLACIVGLNLLQTYSG
ncbi:MULTISPECIES: preprotein translocase subunit SecG [Corynebacterium]|uniref:Protein-export membrane protein SecG n=1 Tax=Corynebacterium flavescens TaxID=28028 RepID=A0A1L7CM08_CORFL|nr:MULTISPECIES: preprotein translocase subunit SecG [Corynebacterium]APT86900.1 preprotein translocase subunit SecG [Corynebacterium flavescens]KAA8722092.1 preprotein translocase subunit SecG [Corynebacterium flavescens]MDN6100000.1 preprotein translocase subunit SecG [Corynebacterium flavescens]MDN6199545.1 preprotein translocase subunit SecG [Corynebacterium flavescens]MDN6227282.1 preprotein translocase subunit SecG [Corynebacterium flavescens]